MEHLYNVLEHNYSPQLYYDYLISTKGISPNFRGSHPKKYCKKALLKNLETFTEEKRYDVMLYIQSKVDGSVNAGKF